MRVGLRKERFGFSMIQAGCSARPGRCTPADPAPTNDPLVYVSYAWGDDSPEGKEREQVVDELCEALQTQDGIEVGRDKRRQAIGDSIEDFAAEIAKARIVLVVMSKKYLRSRHCMVEELLQKFRRCNWYRAEFKRETVLLLLDDAQADFAISEDLQKHWDAYLADEERKLMHDESRTGSPHAQTALEDVKELRRRMTDMLGALGDSIMPRGYKEISRNDFVEIRGLINKRLSESQRPHRRKDESLVPDRPIGGYGPLREPTSLALIISRGILLQEGGKWWEDDSPWKWHTYSCLAKLYSPEEKKYVPADGFKRGLLTENGESQVIISKDASGLSHDMEALESITFEQLIKQAIEWIDGRDILLEIFAPTELLLYNWDGIEIEETFGSQRHLAEEKYLLRPAERINDSKKYNRLATMQERFKALEQGSGLWLHADELNSSKALEAEAKKKTEYAALRSLKPFRDNPIAWLDRFEHAMLPLALFSRSAPPHYNEADANQYLKDAYGGWLCCGEDGKVSPHSRDHDSISNKRTAAATEKLTPHLVLVVDHPDRFPLSKQANQNQPLTSEQT